MPDELDVEGEAEIRSDDLVQYLVGLLGRRVRRHEPEALREPVDVSVDRHDRASERETEDASGRLRPDALDRCEVVQGSVIGQVPEVIQARYPLLAERLEHSQDRLALLGGQARGTNRLLQRLTALRTHLVPPGIALLQVRPGSIAIHVGSVLAEDREDQLVQRVEAWLPRVPVAGSQLRFDPFGEARCRLRANRSHAPIGRSSGLIPSASSSGPQGCSPDGRKHPRS